MTYKVSLVDRSHHATRWWDNYRATMDLHGSYWADELVVHNARDIVESETDIEFDSEEDFLVFRLKFS